MAILVGKGVEPKPMEVIRITELGWHGPRRKDSYGGSGGGRMLGQYVNSLVPWMTVMTLDMFEQNFGAVLGCH